MRDDRSAIRKRPAKTAVLILALGALLCGAVALIVERTYGRWLIALLLAAPVTALLAFVLFDALRTGILPLKGRAMSRDHQPLAYWFNVSWFTACGILLGVMTVWSGTELMAAALDRP